MGIFDFLRTGITQKSHIKPVVLVVIDGWGVAPPSEGNAIALANTPNLDSYPGIYPHGELLAAGESVGLPANEDGNSEVGHLAIGSGRVMYQSLKRINIAIEDGSFYNNDAFVKAMNHIRNHNSRLHIAGLVGTGGVHSSIDHFYALTQFCNKYDIKNVCFHLFTDGRDTPPKEAIDIFNQIETHLKTIKIGQIASIAGRYWAMDRDRRWDRTERVYNAMVMGQGLTAPSSIAAIEAAYAKGQTDEFIEPTVITQNLPAQAGVQPVGTIQDNDAFIFFNFRIDRPRQLTMAFVLSDFENLKSFKFGNEPDQGTQVKETKLGHTFRRLKWPKNLFFVSMTEYQKNLPVSAIAFAPQVAQQPLSEILSSNNLNHYHLAESEKERMVTFYFDGMRGERFPNEDVQIVPSPKVETYDKKPEMSLFKLVDEFKKALKRDKYHFFVMNLANPDMVAHSGNLQATIKACEYVDRAIGQIVDLTLAAQGAVIITADHGNAEELLTFEQSNFFFTSTQGSTNTDHSANPVPVIIINDRLKGQARFLGRGGLSDVAPTILALMGLQPSPAMTGRNLLA